MLRTIVCTLLIGLPFAAPAQGLIFDPAYRHQLDADYASGYFRGGDAYMLAPVDDPSAGSYFSVFQYLQGRVPGLMIYNTYSMVPWVSYRYARPAFFLDEMRVDASLLNTVNMNDIALIKVFRPPFIGAPGNGMGGAIAVYTRRGDEE